MKKYTRRLLVVISLIVISCKSEKSTPELEKYFTEDQISDLNQITGFFVEQICDTNEDFNFKSCFEIMLPKLVKNGWNPIRKTIDLEQQKEMYNSLSKETFGEIWGYHKVQHNSKEIKFKPDGINTSGKYLKFIEEIGYKNDYVAKYTKEIYSSGDVPSRASLQNYIYINPNDLNLDDYNIQVLIAIHYLTQNDE